MFANTPEYGDLLLEGLRDIFSARSNDELVGKLRDTSKKSIPLPSRESWITSEGVTLRFAPGLFDTMDYGYRATVVIPLDKIAPLLTDEGKDYMNPTLANKLTTNK